MLEEKVIKELSDSIKKVYDKNGNEIPFKEVKLQYFKSKYSSTGRETLTLFLDNIPIFDRKHNKIEYECSCGRISCILLCKFLLKERLRCQHCREDADKIRNHKEFFQLKKQGIKIEKKEKYVKRVYDFNNESDSFKEKYFENNLTLDEFNKAIKYIYSINNIPIEGKNIEFIIADNGINAKKYRQMIIIDDVKYPFKNIMLRCPYCGKIFHITRMIKERVKKNHFDCLGCLLNNKTFALKKIREDLHYQGKSELLFINKCEENNWYITNGINIPYMFNGKLHYYKVDFFILEKNLLVEIKDNHIWHKKQVESGKWDAKEQAVKQYCAKNNLQFKLLFTKDILNFFSSKEIV